MLKEALIEPDVTQVKKQIEKPDNPPLGIFYFCLSGFIFCLNFLCGKVLFEHHPDLGSSQLMVYRSTVSCLILIVMLNKRLKYIMIDSIDRSSVAPLATRTLTGNLSIFVNFMTVQTFNLTTAAMVINCSPFVTLFLAGPILGEKVGLIDILKLVIAFSAIALVILCGREDKNAGTDTNLVAPTLAAYIALVLNPFCISAG